MADQIIWLLCVWGCGLLFFGIGVFAERRQKPMWFWSGTTVPAEKLADVAAYNRANGRMWKLYSLPYWLAGVCCFRWPTAARVLLAGACTIGLVWLVRQYGRIYKRYQK